MVRHLLATDFESCVKGLFHFKRCVASRNICSALVQLPNVELCRSVCHGVRNIEGPFALESLSIEPETFTLVMVFCRSLPFCFIFVQITPKLNHFSVLPSLSLIGNDDK